VNPDFSPTFRNDSRQSVKSIANPMPAKSLPNTELLWSQK
jgi:hypothetical protein